ncbi:MAG: phosphotransferase [Thermomicrobiales bacterium]
MTLSPEIIARVERLMDARPAAWSPVQGGYSLAGRWVVRLADDRSIFAKVGTTGETAEQLRLESEFYSHVAAAFMPTLRGWEDGDEPILLLEDLSGAFWPPPWSPERVDRVLRMLAAVAATPPPPHLPTLASKRQWLTSWVNVADDPAPFLSLGLCSAAWLDAALPSLLAAEARADLSGDSLLHLDVRSDNLCFAGDRAVLVDWNHACRGNARVDIACWLPSLAAEGGPDPMSILPDESALAALMSGYFAARAGLPPPAGAPRVRAVQLSQLKRALPWAAASLGLPPPVPW